MRPYFEDDDIVIYNPTAVSFHEGGEIVKPLMTMAEVAELLGVSQRWVRRALAQNLIAYVRVGRLVRIERTSLEVFLDAHRFESQ